MKKLHAALALAGLVAGQVHANTCSIRQAGATDQTVYVTFLDATTGVPTAGLAFNTSGIDLEYVRTAASAVDITEATQTTNGAHADGGFVSVGHGRYRLDLPDAAVAAGVPEVVVQGVITGYIMAPCTVSLNASVAQTGDSFARLGAPAGASVSADVAAVKSDSAAILVDTGTTLDDLVDDLESRLGTPSNFGGGATVAANLADIEAQTDDIGAAGAGLTVLATQASVNTIDDFLDTEMAAVVTATSAASIRTALGLASANLDTQLGAIDDFVDTEVAAILDDTGTTGVVVAEATSNCREVLGCDTQGTLNGTHSATTADLGTNAPANDITGMTLVVPTHNFSRVITSYNTGTGVATFDTTAVTLANSNQYYLYATAPSSGGGGGLDAAGVRAAIGLASANLDTQLGAIDDAVDTEVAAIKTKTDFLPSATAGASGGVFIAGTNAATTITTALTTTFTGNLTGSVGSVATNGITAASIATDAIGAAEIASDAGTELGTANWATTTRVLTAGTNIALAKGTGVTGFNDLSAAQVNTEVDTALTDIFLDRLLANDYDPASKPGTATALLNEIIESDAGVSRFTTNALENGPAGGGGGSSDWSAGEREQIRHRLGIDGTATAPSATPSLASAAALQVVDDFVDDLETRLGTPSNLGSGATVAGNLIDIESQTDDIGVAGAGLTAADDAVMTRLGSPAGASVVADIATRASQSSVDDLPTNAELATSQAAADDATLAAIAALPTAIGDLVIEPEGPWTLKCVLAVIFAERAGVLSTTGGASTYRDPSGTEIRLTGTVASAGNRGSIAVTCPD
jgi:hypothetical protein